MWPQARDSTFFSTGLVQPAINGAARPRRVAILFLLLARRADCDKLTGSSAPIVILAGTGDDCSLTRMSSLV